MKKQFLTALLLILLLVACGKEARLPVPTSEVVQVTDTAVLATATTTSLPTVTPTLVPTTPPTAAPSSTATAIPTETPTSSPTVPIWVSAGTAVPQPRAVIAPDNAAQVTELARWGRGVINDVAYSGDGRWLAVATSIGLYIHDTQNLDEQPRPIQEGKPINRVIFSPESNLLVSLAPRQPVHIWQTADWSLVQTISSDAENITFSPDGNYLALILPTYRSIITLWDLQKQDEIVAYSNATAITFSPDQSIYAISFGLGRSTYISVYQFSDNSLLDTIQIESCDDCLAEEVASLAFTSNGEVLLVGKGTENGSYNDTGEIEARRVHTGDVIYTIPRAKNHDHLTYVCDSPFFTFEPLYPPSPGRMILSPNEETFGIVYIDGGWTTVILYRSSDGILLKIFPEGTNSLTFAPNSSKIITGSTDGRVQLWQSSDLSLVANIEGYDAPVAGLTFAPDGESIVVEHPNSVRLRRVEDGAVLDEFTTAVKATYSPDSRQLALGYRDGHIEVLNSDSGSVNYQMATHTAPITQLLFTPDGQKLISIDQNCGMFVWQADDGTFLWPLQDFITEAQVVGESRIRVASSIISPDGQYLIGTFDPINQFGIWQIDNGSLVGTFPDGQEVYLRELMIVPGSNVFMASGGTQSYTAYSFWDINSGELISELDEDDSNSYYFVDIAISPDGQLMADSSGRGYVEMREISNGQQLTTFEIDSYVRQIDVSLVINVAFSPDGRFLATGSSDGTVRLWGIP